MQVCISHEMTTVYEKDKLTRNPNGNCMEFIKVNSKITEVDIALTKQMSLHYILINWQ